MIEYALMGAGAVAAGFIASLLGIGGGLFIVPWLNLVFGLPIHQAIAASLIAIIATSSGASSVYLKNEYADIGLGLTLGLATAFGAMSGGIVAGYLDQEVLSLIFAIVLVYAAISLGKKQTPRAAQNEHSRDYHIQKYPLGLGASFVAGNISGLLGVGGGIVTVPVMHLIMGVPLKIASATSSFMIGITGCASAFLYYFRGEVNFLVTGVVVLGIFLGSYYGSFLLFKIKTKVLRPVFVIIILFMALKMFLKGTGLSLF
jgi:uncharacterized membrane protein YfcA